MQMESGRKKHAMAFVMAHDALARHKIIAHDTTQANTISTEKNVQLLHFLIIYFAFFGDLFLELLLLFDFSVGTISISTRKGGLCLSLFISFCDHFSSWTSFLSFSRDFFPPKLPVLFFCSYFSFISIFVCKNRNTGKSVR